MFSLCVLKSCKKFVSVSECVYVCVCVGGGGGGGGGVGRVVAIIIIIMSSVGEELYISGVYQEERSYRVNIHGMSNRTENHLYV